MKINKILAILLVASLGACTSTTTKSSKHANRTSEKVYGTKRCAITFDDGPHKNDYRILSILAKENVKATFFYNGNKAQANPALVRKVVAAGHGLGNHSYSHKNLKQISHAQQRSEIIKAQNILERYGRVKSFRPGFGSITSYSRSVLREEGLRETRWNVDTNDWRAASSHMIVNAAARSRNIAVPIILMHSTSNKTVAALPTIIKDLKAQGCRFITF
ncbi:MAG: polysaccharide deacetylase family protein [Alphaproteobacteria bacterium]